MIQRLREYATAIEDSFLEEVANKSILDFSMDINYDDREIDVFYFPNRPLKFIRVNVVLTKKCLNRIGVNYG